MELFLSREDALSLARELARVPEGKWAADFDDTANLFAESILPPLNSASGKNHSYLDLNDYNWPRFWGMPLDQINEIIRQHVVSDSFYQMPLQKDFDMIAKKLIMKTLVTSRPEWQRPYIRGYMAIKGLPQFTDVECCNTHEDSHAVRHKEDVCEEKGIRIFFEDATHHVIRCAKRRTVVFMMNHPWNQGANDLPTSVIRYRTYEEVGNMLRL